MIRISRKLAAVAGLALSLWSSAALAEEAAKPARRPAVATLPIVEIKGRPARPQVAVEVARVLPIIKLSELRQPFAERIGQAVAKDAF